MREQLTDMLSKLTLRYFVLHKEQQTVEADIATVRAALGALDEMDHIARKNYEEMIAKEAAPNDA